MKDKQTALHFACPDDAPFLWNWDARRHRDVSIAVHTDTAKSVVLRMTDHNSDTPSTFEIYLGCSPNDLSERTIRFTHVASSEQTQ